MKENSKDEEELRKGIYDKGTKKSLASLQVRRGNTECQEAKPYFLPKSHQIFPTPPCDFSQEEIPFRAWKGKSSTLEQKQLNSCEVASGVEKVPGIWESGELASYQ